MVVLIQAMIFGSSYVRAKTICPSNSGGTVERTIELKHNPNYFLRYARETRELSFASAEGLPNQILNLNTGQTTDVPGSLDPVLTPDGKLLVVPQAAVKDKSGLRVTSASTFDTRNVAYRMSAGEVHDRDDKVVALTVDDLERRGDNVLFGDALVFYGRKPGGGVETSFVEPNAGNYQTLGVRRRGEGETFYRLLFEQSGSLLTRDYRRDDRTGRVTPAGEMRPACRGSTLSSLPVMRADGREFVFYDVVARETKIMAFNDHGGCDQLDAIPALIGKADFSPNGRYLAFHVDQKIEFRNKIFPVPEKDQKLGIYLYDRQTKTLSLVHDEGATNSYYPVFLDDREIAFIEGSGDPEHPKMAIKFMTIEGARGFACRGCADTEELREASGLLGAMYGARCGTPDLSGGNAVIALARLSAEACREFTRDLTDAQVRTAQIKFDANVAWDRTSSAKTMKGSGRGKIERPTFTMTAEKLAAVCARIDAGAAPAAAETAK